MKRSKKLHVINRILVIVYILTLLFPVFAIKFDSVAAPGAVGGSGANALGQSLFAFARGNVDVDIPTVSSHELRTFGVFLSNFYIPFQTNFNTILGYSGSSSDTSSDSSGDTTVNTGSATSYDLASKIDSLLFGGGNSQIAKTKQLVELLAKGAVGSQARTTELKVNHNDTWQSFNLWYVFEQATGSGFTAHSGDNGPVVFSFAGDNASATVLMMTILSNTSGFNTYLNEVKAATNTDYDLMITPYGDIIDKRGTVVIPGCLNPYTFVKSGGETPRLPINNSFFLGNMANISVDGNGSPVTPETSPMKVGGRTEIVKTPVSHYDLGRKYFQANPDETILVYGIETLYPFSNDESTSTFDRSDPHYDILRAGLKGYKPTTISSISEANSSYITVSLNKSEIKKITDIMESGILGVGERLFNWITGSQTSSKSLINGAGVFSKSEVVDDLGLFDPNAWRNTNLQQGAFTGLSVQSMFHTPSGSYYNAAPSLIGKFFSHLDSYIEDVNSVNRNVPYFAQHAAMSGFNYRTSIATSAGTSSELREERFKEDDTELGNAYEKKALVKFLTGGYLPNGNDYNQNFMAAINEISSWQHHTSGVGAGGFAASRSLIYLLHGFYGSYPSILDGWDKEDFVGLHSAFSGASVLQRLVNSATDDITFFYVPLEELPFLSSADVQYLDTTITRQGVASFVYHLGYDSLTSKFSSKYKNTDSLTVEQASYTERVSKFFNNSFVYKLFSLDTNYNSFLNMVSDAKKSSDGQFIDIANRENLWMQIYLAYMTNIMGVNLETGNITGYMGVLPALDVGSLGLPDFSDYVGSQGSAASTEAEANAIQGEIVQKIYGLLSEDDNAYRNKWLKSTVNGWILDAHYAIIGSDGGSDVTGVGRTINTYMGFTGHVTIPKMSELPFTKVIVDNYMWIYLILVLLLAAVLIMTMVTGYRKFRDALGIFLLMIAILLLPNFLLDGVIALTNRVADNIYSTRFKFWAIVQHNKIDAELNAAPTSDSMLLVQNIQMATEASARTSGVSLKWMAPKKIGTFDQIFNVSKANENLVMNTTIFRWLFSSYVSQEFYTDNPLDTYLYRPYSDVVRSANELYTYMGVSDPDLEGVYSRAESLRSRGARRNSGLFSAADAFRSPSFNEEYLDKIFSYATWRDYNDLVRASVNDDGMHWKNVVDSEVLAVLADDELRINSNAGLSLEVDPGGREVFLKYSESVFYYFYNVLKAGEDPFDSQINGADSFSELLLSEDFFKVTARAVDDVGGDSRSNPIVGKTKDFLDMYRLFTVVIPFLDASNAYVVDWTDLYGTSVVDFDVSEYDPEVDPDPDRPRDPLMVQRIVSARDKKEALGRVWNMYSPWVHQMKDAAKSPDTFRYAGNRYTAANGINPYSYYRVDRPMIFGEADMVLKNFSKGDLSNVEEKILKFLDQTEIDFKYLVNYIGFSDEVLLCAAAMQATFNFNQIFSSSRILAGNNILYPQGYELRNFNYDAFLRMILLTSTGEPLMQTQNLYEVILQKTSFLTGILLLMNDFVAVYVLPVAKLLIVVLIFFLGLLLCMSCFLNRPEKIFKTVMDALIIPLLMFAGMAIAHAYILSLMMGEGITDLVGSKSVAVMTNDPTSTLLILIAINVAMVFFCVKLIMRILSSFKKHLPASMLSLAGTLGTAGVAVGAFAGGAMSSMVGTGYRKLKNRKRKDKNVSGGSDDGAANEVGKGTGKSAPSMPDSDLGLGEGSASGGGDSEEKITKEIDDAIDKAEIQHQGVSPHLQRKREANRRRADLNRERAGIPEKQSGGTPDEIPPDNVEIQSEGAMVANSEWESYTPEKRVDLINQRKTTYIGPRPEKLTITKEEIAQMEGWGSGVKEAYMDFYDHIGVKVELEDSDN